MLVRVRANFTNSDLLPDLAGLAASLSASAVEPVFDNVSEDSRDRPIDWVNLIQVVFDTSGQAVAAALISDVYTTAKAWARERWKASRTAALPEGRPQAIQLRDEHGELIAEFRIDDNGTVENYRDDSGSP